MGSACFLDLDGVFWPNNPSNSLFKLSKPSFEVLNGLEELRRHFSYVAIVTNQTSIARQEIGFRTAIRTVEKFLSQKHLVGLIDCIFVCPHHLNAKRFRFRKNCDCRKPNPGGILNIAKKYDINLESSIFIGDRITDAEAASRAGVGKVFLLYNDSVFERNLPLSAFEGLVRFKLIRRLEEALTTQ